MYFFAAAAVAALISAAVLRLQAAPADAQQPIDPASFSPVITNPLFPLSSLGPKSFVGETTDPDTNVTVVERLESRVLPDTAIVAGVTVLVLEEKAYVDDELIEVALDYFAQHTNGDVYYFGERVDNYENGVLKDHHGQWLAGNGNLPGVNMAAHPQVGKTYDQEVAPGIAEDKATVLSLDEIVSTPSGSYSNCMKTKEFSPLEPGVEEFKFHCPGVGLAREDAEDGFIELVSIGAAPAAVTPVPTVAAPPPAPTTPARTGVTAPNTGDGPDAYEQPLGWIALAIAVGAVSLVAGARVRHMRSGRR
jgi:hypothetical protein